MNLELYSTLYEANFDPWESVSTVIQHTGERTEQLLTHILETKLLYWNEIRKQCPIEEPPNNLEALLHYELEQIKQLSDAHLELTLEYSGRTMNVAQLIRLSARHSVWHAGQIALTKP
jgi:uncharacterized damage-inducible protein DinB